MIGELCALSSAFSFSTVNIAIRRGMRKSRDNGTFLSTFVNMIVFLVLIGVLYVGRYLPALTWTGFLLFSAAGLLTTFVGRSLHYEAIRVIGPSRAISLRMGAPIVTVCLAFVFLSERFSVLQYVGATAIILGVWVLSRETMGRGDLRVVETPSFPCDDTSRATGESCLGKKWFVVGYPVCPRGGNKFWNRSFCAKGGCPGSSLPFLGNGHRHNHGLGGHDGPFDGQRGFQRIVP